jgi:hypothetical protein
VAGASVEVGAGAASVDSPLAGVVSAPLVVSGAAAAAGSELLLEQPMTKPPRIAAIASVRIVVSLWVLCFCYNRRHANTTRETPSIPV